MTKNCGSQGTGYCYSTCQTGWHKSGNCDCEPNDCSGYVLSTTVGMNCDGIASCKSGDTYVYKCTGCAPGYKLNDAKNQCVNQVCGDIGTNYSTTIVDHCTSISVGKIGETYCYLCSECEDGYSLSNGTCGANICSYSTNASVANCISHSVTRTGLDLCYQCTACETGYTLSNNTCSANTCSEGSSTSLTTDFYCANGASVAKVGTNYCYTCN